MLNLQTNPPQFSPRDRSQTSQSFAFYPPIPASLSSVDASAASSREDLSDFRLFDIYTPELDSQIDFNFEPLNINDSPPKSRRNTKHNSEFSVDSYHSTCNKNAESERCHRYNTQEHDEEPQEFQTEIHRLRLLLDATNSQLQNTLRENSALKSENRELKRSISQLSQAQLRFKNQYEIKSQLFESMRVKVQNLELQIAALKLDLQNKVDSKSVIEKEWRGKFDRLEVKERKARKECESLKKYIGDVSMVRQNEDGKQFDKEKEELNSEISKLSESNQLLQTQLKSLERVNALQEQYWISSIDAKNTKESISIDTELLSRWRTKVFELLVQKKFSELHMDQKLNHSKERIKKLEKLNHSNSIAIQISNESLQVQKSESTALRKINNSLESQLVTCREEITQQKRETGKLRDIITTLLQSVNEITNKLEDFRNLMSKRMARLINRLFFAQGRLSLLNEVKTCLTLVKPQLISTGTATEADFEVQYGYEVQKLLKEQKDVLLNKYKQEFEKSKQTLSTLSNRNIELEEINEKQEMDLRSLENVVSKQTEELNKIQIDLSSSANMITELEKKLEHLKNKHNRDIKAMMNVRTSVERKDAETQVELLYVKPEIVKVRKEHETVKDDVVKLEKLRQLTMKFLGNYQ